MPKLIHAIVRPEKAAQVLQALKDAGQLPVSRMSVFGRGRQRGLKSKDVYYDEIPKENIYIAVEDGKVEIVSRVIADAARTGNGTPGDGKIFVYPIERVVTISSGEPVL